MLFYCFDMIENISSNVVNVNVTDFFNVVKHYNDIINLAVPPTLGTTGLESSWTSKLCANLSLPECKWVCMRRWSCCYLLIPCARPRRTNRNIPLSRTCTHTCWVVSRICQSCWNLIKLLLDWYNSCFPLVFKLNNVHTNMIYNPVFCNKVTCAVSYLTMQDIFIYRIASCSMNAEKLSPW